MDARNKYFWLPILIGIPIGILINLVTQLLNVQVAISIAVVSIIAIAYFVFSERVIGWFAERNRQNRAKAAKKLEDEIAELESLKSDLPKLVARVVWDTIVFQLVASIVIIFALIAVSAAPLLPSLLNLSTVPALLGWQGLIPGVLVGSVYSLISELRGLRYIRHLYQFDEYKKETRAKIAQLISHEPEIKSASYETSSNETDITLADFPILSGKNGAFAYSPDGPWQKPVICNPIHGAWKPALQSIPGAQWVWIKEKPTDKEAQEGQTVWHRLSFTIAQPQIETATLILWVDDHVKLYVNDKFVQKISMTEPVFTMSLKSYLQSGNNSVLMEIQNNASPQATGESNPTGVIYRLEVR